MQSDEWICSLIPYERSDGWCLFIFFVFYCVKTENPLFFYTSPKTALLVSSTRISSWISGHRVFLAALVSVKTFLKTKLVLGCSPTFAARASLGACNRVWQGEYVRMEFEDRERHTFLRFSLANPLWIECDRVGSVLTPSSNNHHGQSFSLPSLMVSIQTAIFFLMRLRRVHVLLASTDFISNSKLHALSIHEAFRPPSWYTFLRKQFVPNTFQ